MTRKQKERFMLEAIKEARKVSEAGEVPVGAVIIHKGVIIGRSHNQVEQLRDATAHAELIAITQASSYLSDWRLKGCSLFVTLEPCLMCAAALKLSRISYVYFGAYAPREGALVSMYDFLITGTKARLPFKVEGGILKNDCASLLKDCFLNLRKT